MQTVNVHDAKTHFSKLLSRAHIGEEIIIAKAGEPYAKLVPLEPVKKRTAGIAKGAVTKAFFEPLTDDELATWQR